MILTLAILGGAICLFLIAILASKRPFGSADGGLLFWLTAQGGAFGTIAVSTGLPEFWPIVWLSLGQLLLFCLGPAQLIYARASLSRPLEIWPQIGAMAGVATVLALLPLIVQLETRSGAIVANSAPLWLIFLPPAALLVSAAWPVMVLHLARQARGKLKDRYSNLAELDPGWMEVWAISSLIVILAALLAVPNSILGILPVSVHVGALLGFQILQVAYVAHRGLTRPGIFLSAPASAPRPAIDLAAARADFKAVTRRLADSRIYLDPELTAPRLSDEMGWAPERLTQAFRMGGETNFHDAVLAARLQEMERLARDTANARVTTLALGLDAGFGSKSAMYEAFRRELNTSPAAWRRHFTQS